jgi:hypothetical protein
MKEASERSFVGSKLTTFGGGAALWP